MNAQQKYDPELQRLYKGWTGEIAQNLEREALKESLGNPEYMVIVVRHIGRHLKRTEYLFASYLVAQACYAYWAARKGVEMRVLGKIINQFGFVQEPDIHM